MTTALFLGGPLDGQTRQLASRDLQTFHVPIQPETLDWVSGRVSPYKPSETATYQRTDAGDGFVVFRYSPTKADILRDARRLVEAVERVSFMPDRAHEEADRFRSLYLGGAK